LSALAIEKRLQLLVHIDRGVPGLILGDEKLVRQIIDNLLSNAIKFTENGRISLRLEAKWISSSEVSLLWKVSDSGKGIPHEQQSKIFEPYYKELNNRPDIKGAGLRLGLSICRSLSTIMGGSISVVSEPGLGSSFSFALPAKVADSFQPLCNIVKLPAELIYVRAASRDLSQNIADWIANWGATARIINSSEVASSSDALLVDGTTFNEATKSWAGPIVAISEKFGLTPLLTCRGAEVSSLSLEGIALAIKLVLERKIEQSVPQSSK
ncbi:hypothetical protein HNP46_007220, partial [Pseudomonas nitritireducens]